MNRLLLRAAALPLALIAGPAAAGPAVPAPAAPDPGGCGAGEFTLVVLPDTQRYASTYPRILWSQMRWIRDNAAALQTRMVLHEGDIVDRDTPEQWAVADAAFELIDGVVPYLVVPGNHDYSNALEDQGFKASSNFNAVFSPYRFQNHPWYGDHYGVTANNSFAFFEGGGQKYMVLGLEWGPTDDVLAWASDMVRKHKDDNRVILLTHAYMNNDDKRLGEGGHSNPHTSNKAWNDGEQIWDKLVRRQPPIGMVLSGHVGPSGKLISTNDKGGQVLQLGADYQEENLGGGGYLRIMKFKPAEKTIEVFTYSPWYGRFRTEAAEQFTVAAPWMFREAPARAPNH